MFHLLQHWVTDCLKAFGLSSAAAGLTGVVCGLIAGPMGWGFGILALFVGLAAGLTARLVRFENVEIFKNNVASCCVAIAATLLGLTMYGLVIFATTPHWSAQQEVGPEELDFTVRKYLTGQLCRERRIVAFGYDEVPQEIKDEAAEQMAKMSTDKKNILVDKKFGGRINEGDSVGTGSWLYASSGVAVVGAMVLAVGALTLHWRRHHER